MEKFDTIVKHTFNKSERLTSRKDIQELFNNGSYFYIYPYKILYQKASNSTAHKVLFSVPKKVFKRAVDRNLLKRRMREAYRLHKHELLAHPQMLNIAYIYTAKKLISFNDLAKPMIASIARLKKYAEKKRL